MTTQNNSIADRGFIRDELLHELFESTVIRYPHRIAVQCGEQSITYRELEERANRLASYLRKQGVRRENRVALFLPRSEQVYMAMLAVLKSGAAYVPLDPETPAERIQFILKDCGVKCLITQSGLAKNLNGVANAVCLDLEEAEIARQPPTRHSRSEIKTNPQKTSATSFIPREHRGVQKEFRSNIAISPASFRPNPTSMAFEPTTGYCSWLPWLLTLQPRKFGWLFFMGRRSWPARRTSFTPATALRRN